MTDPWNEILDDAPPRGRLTFPEESEWIGEKTRECQEFWHDRFDEHVALREEVGERPDPPCRDDEDHRLIFGFGAADPATRKACLAIFPHGQEMHSRFESYLVVQRPHLLEEAARALVCEIAGHLEAADASGDVDWGRINVHKYSDPEAHKVLDRSESMREFLEDVPFDGSRTIDLASRVALHFLVEPLYAAAGNFYELHSWVTGVLLGPTVDSVNEILYVLWLSDWQVFLHEDGSVVLLHRDDQQG